MACFGDGLAIGGDLLHAAEEATARALVPLGGRAPDLLCVFVAGADPEDVAAAFGHAAQVSAAGATIGCSAGGVIGGAHGVEGRAAVSVFAAVLPDVRLRAFHLEVLTSEEGAAVIGLPEPDGDDVAVLLADPYSFPAEGFLDQVNVALPGLPVVGGLAGGARGAGSTRLLVDGRVVDRGAVGVLVQGAGLRTIVSQGCRPVGPPMTVTAAAGNVLRELAGVPALQRLEQLLAELSPADQALARSGLQIGIAMDEYAEEHDFLVRAILGVERETGGVVVGDLVEVGRTVRLQVRDADAADADLRALLAGYRRVSRDTPAGGVLLFSCNGRGAHLFGASHGGADHDPALVREELAAPGIAGFFAGGELGPVGGRNHLHGFTASVLAFPC
ncbi:MAG: FIST N-terminal domain-containing protein [Mycobacteriales bacterium]